MKRFRHLIGTSISASGGGSGTGQILIKDYDVSFYRSTLPIKGDGGITAGTNYNGVGIKLVGRLVNVALPGDISGTNYGSIDTSGVTQLLGSTSGTPCIGAQAQNTSIAPPDGTSWVMTSLTLMQGGYNNDADFIGGSIGSSAFLSYDNLGLTTAPPLPVLAHIIGGTFEQSFGASSGDYVRLTLARNAFTTLTLGALIEISDGAIGIDGDGTGSGVSLDVHGCTSLTSVSFPALTTLKSNGPNGLQFDFHGCTALTTVNLSALTTFSYGNAGNTINGLISFQGCALSTATVNALLVLLASLTVGNAVNGSFVIDFSGGTNGAPSGAAIAAVATLTTCGFTVSTN